MTASCKIPILVVDDSARADGSHDSLFSAPQIEVIGQAADPWCARDLMVELQVRTYIFRTKENVLVLDISTRTLRSQWSGRRDSNTRPSGPKPDALPGCATPRQVLCFLTVLLSLRNDIVPAASQR